MLARLLAWLLAVALAGAPLAEALAEQPPKAAAKKKATKTPHRMGVTLNDPATCIYHGGYPWQKGGCVNAEDLNAAFALAYQPPTSLAPGVAAINLGNAGGVVAGPWSNLQFPVPIPREALPTPTLLALGGVKRSLNVSGFYLTYIDADGAVHADVVGIADVQGIPTEFKTWAATPTSANLQALVSDETGIGPLVFGIGPALTDPIMGGAKVSTANLDKTNNTFAAVPGLTVALTAGKTYLCSGHLTVTASGASGGAKATLAASGGLSLTSGSLTGTNWNGTTVNAKSTTTSSLGTAVGAATAVTTDIDLVAGLVVNAGGSVVVQAAQNATDAATTTVGQNSMFRCDRTN